MPPGNPAKAFGRRARRIPGEMNKLEQAYAAELTLQQKAGLIDSWEFEKVKLKLAKKTWWCPDFYVVLPDGEVQLHDTKGFMEQHANVKIKVAAEVHPFRVFIVRKKLVRDGGGFDLEEVGL